MSSDSTQPNYTEDYRQKVEAVLSPWGVSYDGIMMAKANMLLGWLRKGPVPLSELNALDVGCGPGNLGRHLRSHFKSFVACDEDPAAVSAVHGVGIPAKLIEGKKLPYIDSDFDLVFCSMVVHHVPPIERLRFFSEIGRVLNKGGRAVILEHNPWNPLARLGVWKCEYDGPEVRLITFSRLAKALRAQGFSHLTGRYFLLVPGLNTFAFESEWLGTIPLGAQYFCIAQKRD